MTLSCTIQGNAVSMLAGSFNASYTLNNTPSASMRVYYVGAPVGDEGDEVVVTRTSDSYIVFAGRITTVNIAVDEANNKFAGYTMSGHEVLADRRIVGEVYINKTAGFIVSDLISKYLTGDGITAGTIDTGALVPRAVFGYQQLSNVLRSLAEANGYIWYIDTAKALHFTERDLITAPFDIDETVSGDRAIRGLRYDRSLTQYRNRQFVQYNELTSERTERFAGDGERQTFTVEFPIANKPKVIVNGFEKTVGISSLDDGKDWYWSKGSNEVSQDLTYPAITTDGTVAKVADGVDVPFLFEIRASGNYAIASYHDTGTFNRGVKLFRLTSTSIDEVFTLPIVTDTLFLGVIANWIDDDFILVQYYNETPNEYTQEVFRREGDILISTGDSMNRPSIFKMASNGRNIVAIRSTNGAQDTLLFTWDRQNNNISQTDSIAYDTNYGTPIVAISGQYIVQLKPKTPFTLDSRIELIKIDTVAETFAVVDYVDQLDFFSVSQVAMIGNYAFVLVPQYNVEIGTSVYIYRINTDTDTITFLERWQLPLSAGSLLFTYLETYGNNLVPVGAFSSGDLAVLKFDVATETLALSFILRDDINGAVSISQSGFGVYDRVSVGDNTIRLFRFAPDVLEVQYYGSFPNVTQVDDFAEQTARIVIEGGTGIYEAFQSASDTDTEPSAIDIGEAILQRYGRIPKAITLETQIQGYEAGQIITINWPSLGIIDEEFLIERIALRDEMASSLWYQLRCISGRDIGNWQEFWRSLRPQASFDFGGSDILPKAAAVQDLVTVTEEVTTVTLATETNWDEGNWDEMEWQ